MRPGLVSEWLGSADGEATMGLFGLLCNVKGLYCSYVYGQPKCALRVRSAHQVGRLSFPIASVHAKKEHRT